MDQQQEYITQYFQAVKAASKTDSQIVAHLFDMIQDYMVTDMTKDQYIKIAMDGMEAGSLTSEDFTQFPEPEKQRRSTMYTVLTVGQQLILF